MSKHKPPPPPTTLGVEGRDFWVNFLKEAEIKGVGRFELLEKAARSLDVIAECRDVVAREGHFVDNRFNERRSHPALSLEQQSVRLFKSCLSALGLDASEHSSVFAQHWAGRRQR